MRGSEEQVGDLYRWGGVLRRYVGFRGVVVNLWLSLLHSCLVEWPWCS